MKDFLKHIGAVFAASALVVVSACGQAQETAQPDVIEDVIQTANTSEEASPASDMSVADRVQTAMNDVYTAYRFEFDESPENWEVWREGVPAEVTERVETCIADLGFGTAAQAACVGIIYSACPGGAGSTNDMANCSRMERNYWDARLNRVYGELRDLWSRQDAEERGYNEDAVQLAPMLLTAQRAWIKYRDESCSMQRNLFRGGTMGRITAADCMNSMTAARAMELESFMSEM